MKVDDFGIQQPDDDKVLYRYMDKWKFDSLLENGLAFTNVMNQSDKNDSKNNYEEDGYTKIDNQDRQFKLVCCWTLDENYSEEKIIKYCSFKRKDEKKECDVAYVLETKFEKLVSFTEGHCRKKNIFLTLNDDGGANYNFRYGNSEYIDINYLKNKKCEKGGITEFQKDLEFEDENEFRLILVRGSAMYVNGKNIHNVDYRPVVEWMRGNPKDYLINVYEYNRITRKFRGIGIPIVPIRTNTLPLCKPTKIF